MPRKEITSSILRFNWSGNIVTFIPVKQTIEVKIAHSEAAEMYFEIVSKALKFCKYQQLQKYNGTRSNGNLNWCDFHFSLKTFWPLAVCLQKSFAIFFQGRDKNSRIVQGRKRWDENGQFFMCISYSNWFYYDVEPKPPPPPQCLQSIHLIFKDNIAPVPTVFGSFVI